MIRIKSKWTLKEQIIFLKRLGELLQQGYHLTEAFSFLTFHMSKNCQDDINFVIEKCKQGETLYDVFNEIGFHKDLLGYLYFAEKHGDISFALIEGSTILQKKHEQTEKLKKIIRYPLFLLIFVGFMITAIEKILLPQFKTLYSSMNYEETIISKLLFNLSSINRFILISFLILSLIGLCYYHFHFEKLHAYQKMKLILKCPIVNQIVILLNSHFFSVQLSNLLKGGLSIFEALSHFEQQKHSHFFQDEAREMKNRLLQGDRFDEIIKSRGFYDKNLPLVISHGQSNGNVVSELHQYSLYIIQRIEERISKIFSIVQPILFAIIGVVIMSLYAMIMIPMLNLLSTI